MPGIKINGSYFLIWPCSDKIAELYHKW